MDVTGQRSGARSLSSIEMGRPRRSGSSLSGYASLALLPHEGASHGDCMRPHMSLMRSQTPLHHRRRRQERRLARLAGEAPAAAGGVTSPPVLFERGTQCELIGSMAGWLQGGHSAGLREAQGADENNFHRAHPPNHAFEQAMSRIERHVSVSSSTAQRGGGGGGNGGGDGDPQLMESLVLELKQARASEVRC